MRGLPEGHARLSSSRYILRESRTWQCEYFPKNWFPFESAYAKRCKVFPKNVHFVRDMGRIEYVVASKKYDWKVVHLFGREVHGLAGKTCTYFPCLCKKQQYVRTSRNIYILREVLTSFCITLLMMRLSSSFTVSQCAAAPVKRRGVWLKTSRLLAFAPLMSRS